MRLSLYGGIGSPYGVYSGKTAQPEPVPSLVPDGGGRGAKGRRKYPRRVILGDRTVWARSPEHERQLLAEYRASLEAQREQAVERGQQVKAQRIAVKVAAVQRREKSADARADEWLERLRQEDEEILVLLQ